MKPKHIFAALALTAIAGAAVSTRADEPKYKPVKLSIDSSMLKKIKEEKAHADSTGPRVWLPDPANFQTITESLLITTPDVERSRATVKYRFNARNLSNSPYVANATISILTGDGKTVASDSTSVRIDTEATGLFTGELPVSYPDLWTPETPWRYSLMIRLSESGVQLDSLSRPFIIRLNSDGSEPTDTPVLTGPVNGARIATANFLPSTGASHGAEARTAALLSQAGFNAVLTETAPSKAFLTECHRRGLTLITDPSSVSNADSLFVNPGIDITGHRSASSHFHEMLHNPYKRIYMAVSNPAAADTTLLDSWNWGRRQGIPLNVEVASRSPRVRLLLNGDVIGEQPVSESTLFRARFNAPFRPGMLRAEGLDSLGNVTEQLTLTTAGAPGGMRLIADRPTIVANGRDVVFVVAELVDVNGTTVPDCDLPIEVAVSGPATVEATASANPDDHTPLTSPNRTTYRGRAIIALRATDTPGTITLTVTAPTLHPSRIRINTISAN